MGAVLVTEQIHSASNCWKFLMRDFFVPWFSSDFPFVNLVTQMETPLFLSPLTVSMSLGVALHWPHMVYGICIHTYRPGKDMSNSTNTWIFTISLGASIKRRNFRSCQVHSWRSSAAAGCSGVKAGCGWDGFGGNYRLPKTTNMMDLPPNPGCNRGKWRFRLRFLILKMK